MRGGGREDVMMDVVYMLLTLGFFGLCALYAAACERM